jgi:hypothetical protein
MSGTMKQRGRSKRRALAQQWRGQALATDPHERQRSARRLRRHGVHEDCTGIHAHGKPYSQQSPAAKLKHADAQARYKQTDKGARTESDRV